MRLPSFASSMEPFIAPHDVCPRTTSSFDPTTFVAYSILPSTSSLTMLPAMRIPKTSPIP